MKDCETQAIAVVASSEPRPLGLFKVLGVELVTLWAQSMAKAGSGVILNILIELKPPTLHTSDLPALHADWEYPVEICQFPLPCHIQNALSFDPVCNIDTAADVALELIVLIKEWGTLIEHPPICAVVTLQPVLDLKRLALANCRVIG